MPSLRVVKRWVLAAPSRGETPASTESLPPDQRLLALEGPDGSTVFMRADALAEQLQRSRPELIRADGSIDFASLGARDATSRGLGDWVWKQVCHLVLERDAITDLALEKASDLLGERVEDLAVAGLLHPRRPGADGGHRGAAGRRAGALSWNGGPLDAATRCRSDQDPRLARWRRARRRWCSSTAPARTLGGSWRAHRRRQLAAAAAPVRGRIFGYEHRTFSESPIDNALALVDVLPAGARICLVTHSRGGLVGDLLCLATDAAADGAGFDALVAAYRRSPRPDECEAEQRDPQRAQRREAHADEAGQAARPGRAAARQAPAGGALRARGRPGARHRAAVRQPGRLPLRPADGGAQGRCLGRWRGGGRAGLAAGGPGRQGGGGRRSLELLARVALEIADKRLQPQVVPGIEA
ncbi:MAG: hypothetical protein IPG93_16985, partial [Burkholderiales bacterium]|nr:hypothetical protein [Burkholderiales bacterium]